ncbi:helix-turn-helix domain-containing protein [Spongiactinospora sp. TRM90649]|uniref:ArsR/SmtB family transcription factor n=1 Tax=Spongiactinospora sp. TRM90649 TaxID=3031114 RepID=UPI0023F8156C|nr:helix-turn-helix domain-containing protein [Spongiactinospora sp. TRM90649]MDF5752222.1 helix-turn-helix domain-containing protein [Spongiactinospora sp. TRM90649]
MKDDADPDAPLILDDPGRLRALSHPLRLRMLKHLGLHGPATSTTLGELFGVKTGTTSYHLRQLERYGFIEEIPERSAGRERWWRKSREQRDLRMPPPGTLPPEDRAVLAELLRAGYEEDLALFRRFPAEYRRDPAWAKMSRGLTWMTAEELDAFNEEYIRLLLRHGHQVGDAPEGARPVYVRFFTVPGDTDPA